MTAIGRTYSLDDETIKRLNQIRDETRKSLSEIVRRAILTYNYHNDAVLFAEKDAPATDLFEPQGDQSREKKEEK